MEVPGERKVALLHFCPTYKVCIRDSDYFPSGDSSGAVRHLGAQEQALPSLPRDRSYIIQADCPRLCEMLPGMEVSSPLLRGKQQGAHEEGECYLESVCVYPTGWAMWKVPSSSSAVETTFMSRLLLPLCPWSSVHPCGGLRVQGSSTHQTSQSSAAHGPGTGSSGYSCST